MIADETEISSLDLLTISFLDTILPRLEELSIDILEARWAQRNKALLEITILDKIAEEIYDVYVSINRINTWAYYPKSTETIDEILNHIIFAIDDDAVEFTEANEEAINQLMIEIEKFPRTGRVQPSLISSVNYDQFCHEFNDLTPDSFSTLVSYPDMLGYDNFYNF